MKFVTKTYVSGIHSLIRVLSYYHKEYYKECMELAHLQSQVKDATKPREYQ
jgi:hypothetical protein